MGVYTPTHHANLGIMPAKYDGAGISHSHCCYSLFPRCTCSAALALLASFLRVLPPTLSI